MSLNGGVFEEILIALGFGDVPELEVPVVEEVPVVAEVPVLEEVPVVAEVPVLGEVPVLEEAEVPLHDLLEAVDFNEMQEFRDVNVEEILQEDEVYEAFREDTFRREFLNRAVVRARLEPLLALMWCLTPWELQPCSCVLEMAIYTSTYFLLPWWKHFPGGQKKSLINRVKDQLSLYHSTGAFFVGGEWCAFNKQNVY